MRNLMRADLLQGSGLPVGLASLSDAQRYRSYVDGQGVEYASDWFTYSLTIPGPLAAGATRTAVLNIQRDSAFEWLMTSAIVYDDSGRTTGDCNEAIEVTVIDSASSRNLMSAACPLGLMAGNGGMPFVLPVSRRFMPQTQVTVAAHNFSSATAFGTAGSGACMISFIGRKIFTAHPSGMMPPGAAPLQRFNSWQDDNTGKRYTEDFYSYVFKFTTMNNGDTLGKTAVIEADSDFEWIMACFGHGEPSTASPSSIAATVQILDGGTNRQLLSQATELANITSNEGFNALFPFMLLQPRIFQSKAPVTVTLTANGNTGITLPYFVMHGRKIFEIG